MASVLSLFYIKIFIIAENRNQESKEQENYQLFTGDKGKQLTRKNNYKINFIFIYLNFFTWKNAIRT